MQITYSTFLVLAFIFAMVNDASSSDQPESSEEDLSAQAFHRDVFKNITKTRKALKVIISLRSDPRFNRKHRIKHKKPKDN